MNRGAVRQQLFVWLLVLGLWALLVAALSAQLVVAADIPWRPAFRLSLRDWFPWLFLSPVVVWLSFQFRLERGRLPVSIPIHLAGCIGALLLASWLTTLSPPPRLERERLRSEGALRPRPQRPFQEGRRERAGQRPLPDRPDRLADPFPDDELQRTPGTPSRPLLNALVFRARFNVPVYWFLVSIVQALTYYRRFEERDRRTTELEARLTRARLEALRMQLHPHFLFNTLNAIATLVHKDPDAADEMIVDLSELLRVALDTSAQEIPLRRELDFLDRYLRIQQVRFGDRLRIEREIDGAALDALVPTLLLQPLVENAVRHGIEPATGPGLLQLQALRQGDLVRLIVRDNGTGTRQPAREQSGIGLSNTTARLKELYGNRALLTLASASDAGFAAEIVLPYRSSAPPTSVPTKATS